MEGLKMADNSNHEIKKHKKKHKKKHRKHEEEAEPANVEPDSKVSIKQESAALDESPETTKPHDEELAANTNFTPEADPVAPQWTHEDKVRLLEEVQKFASNFNRRNFSCFRVEWNKISMEGFTQIQLQEEYKRLTKRVRKLRTIGEIVADAQQILQETKDGSRAPLIKKDKGPSKPVNSFMMFCKAKRPSLVEKHPELGFAEIHKKICERWKVTSSSKREKYVKKYEKAKLLYAEELKKFQEEQLSQIKKPLAAYDMWKLERQRDKDLDGDEIEDDFLVEWDNLPNSMKKGWIQAANSERERYDSEIACITQSHSKVKKSTKSTEKDTSTSDEAQGQKPGKKNRSSNNGHQKSPPTSQKRKSDDSNTADESPRKKVSKQPESSPEKDSESSSDDE